MLIGTHWSRKVGLLAFGALPVWLLIALPDVAGAAVPSPSNSTCPTSVTANPSGTACFDVVVRDFANNPIAGSSVAVDFSGCTIAFCPTQPHSGNMVIVTSDGIGVAHFCICATTSGGCSAPIYADGVGLCTVPVLETCASQIPQTISYQGVLTDNTGAIPPDGPHNFTFAIYDDPSLSGAHLLLTENHNAVQVIRGGFNVGLGMGTPPVPLTISFDKPYYLGISVDGGAELSPRVTLASSPYALNARSVSACGVTSSSIASGQVVKNLNGLHDAVTLAAGTNVTITPSGQTLTIAATGGGGLGGSGTVNNVAKFIGATTLGNSALFENGGKLGFNRVATLNAFEVEGNASKTTAGSWGANSDARIKTDVSTISGALETLDRVRLVHFHYTDQYRRAHPSIGDRRYCNVIAQEFQNVFPDDVKGSGEKLPSGEEILQVDTYPLTIYSAAAIQELHRMLAAKDREIAQLREEVAAQRNSVARMEARFSTLEKAVARVNDKSATAYEAGVAHPTGDAK